MSSLPKSLRTAVERLRAPLAMRLYMSKRDREDVIGRFHILYYDLAPRTWKNTRWLGVPVRKLPLDLWLYQELVHDLRPELIVETGTLQGGSAVFLGTICELIDHGRVVSIDIAPERKPAHPRVTYLVGSSTSEKVLAQVRQMAQDAKSVLVILDSDHSRAHVLEELRAFGPLVTPGSYVVV